MTTATGTPSPQSASGPAGPGLSRRPWWKRPWIAPLGLLTLSFIGFSLPPYLTGDPSLSRVMEPEGFPAHYPLVVIHVVTGSIAMVACFFQVWTWFRRRYPKVHRWTGRIYVAAVVPGGLTGLVIGAATPHGPAVAVSSVMLALLWLGCTVAGFRMARQRRFVDHRRWMLRSFALTYAIIANRIFVVLAVVALADHIPDEATLRTTVATIGGWLGWTVTLLLVEWWLEREDAAKRRARTRHA
ncbi:DUF2306 domain-containing protein [Rhizohabitans arisaemae]|uniref:DUF2306 domain-containing protein n=1 Tax=Rhizohabitans arisaemae TaxID=2720610 RepID=UPI0024B04458|nr:DUF2306 domain-containing protein [Rhizohabitans arisaemae]